MGGYALGREVKSAALALLIAASAAQADVVAEFVEGDFRVELHKDAGPCVGEALWAVLLHGRERVPGCWILTPEGVQIAWLNGKADVLPARLFRKPEIL